MPFRYPLHSISECLEAPPPLEFIVEPLFSAGSINLVFGPGGVGKTYSMADCMMCAALGKDWLGFKIKEPTHCLIVDEENGLYRLRCRLHEIVKYHGANQNTQLRFTTMCMIDLLHNKQDMIDLGEMIAETKSKLVLLDSFIDFIPGGDENSSRDVQPIFHGLRSIAEKNRCAFIILDHSGKDIGRGVRGTSAKRGAVDLALLVQSGKKSNSITFKCEKARDIDPNVEFTARGVWHNGSFHLEESDPTPEQEHMNASQAFIIRSLVTHGDLNTNQLKELGRVEGFAPGTMKNVAKELCDAGKIERIDDGAPNSLAVYRVLTANRGITFLRGSRTVIEE